MYHILTNHTAKKFRKIGTTGPKGKLQSGSAYSFAKTFQINPALRLNVENCNIIDVEKQITLHYK